MSIGFDAYSLVARILPGYIVIAPLTLLLVFSPADVQLSFGGAALLIPILYFFSYQIGRDRGKNIEPQLWDKWGGAPVTRFLRHSNTEFDKHTRITIHDDMRAMGNIVPSPEEEERDPKGADHAYGTCGRTIIRRTRDTERFPLVFRSLTTYGFHRNLYGLKPFGIATTILSLAACIAITVVVQAALIESVKWPSGAVLSASIAILANVALLVIWVFKVTEQTVKQAADEYAHFLLETAVEPDGTTRRS